MVLLLWLAFGLRLHRLDFQSIWWDEGHSIFVASHPLAQIPTLPAMDVHPPAYFWLLRLWLDIAGRSEFALRFLSVIFSLLTVALLWRFAAEIARPLSINPSTTGFLAALLAACSPMYVAYSQEVRSYALITFLALVSTVALWKITLGGNSREVKGTGGNSKRVLTSSKAFLQTSGFRWLLLYIISTAACLYTHYFTVFLLLFQNAIWLSWVVMGKRKKISRQPSAVNGQQVVLRAAWWISSQLGVLLLFVPQLRLALRQVTTYTNPNLAPPSLTFFITRSWQAYTVGLTIDPAPATWGMLLIAAILVIIWPAILLLNPKFSIFNFQFSIIFLLLWFLLPLAAYFLILQRQPSFEPRYLMLITPALFLLLAVGLIRFVDTLRTTQHTSHITYHISRLTLPAIPLIIFLLALRSYYTNETYFKDDSAGVANWLAAEATANDIIYVDTPHPFHYYAEQRNIPAPMRYLFVDIHTAAETLNREAAGRNRLFWVTWWGSDTDPRGVIPFLSQKAGRLMGQQDFKGYRITWFDLSEGKPFSLPNTLTPTAAIFGDALRLDGLAFGESTSVAGPAWATLRFTLLRETEVNYKVSLRLRGATGQIVAQLDRDLLNDRHFRTSAWSLNDPALNQAINVYMLPLPVGVAPGLYQLEAVVYNTIPPYPSEGVSNHPTGDGVSAILGQITIAP
jgi:uncharacterized membrane protein